MNHPMAGDVALAVARATRLRSSLLRSDYPLIIDLPKPVSEPRQVCFRGDALEELFHHTTPLSQRNGMWVTGLVAARNQDCADDHGLSSALPVLFPAERV